MTNYMMWKAGKILSRVDAEVVALINENINLYAKAIVTHDEKGRDTWRNRIAGVTDTLESMKVISFKEKLFLDSYAIKKAYEESDKMKQVA